MNQFSLCYVIIVIAISILCLGLSIIYTNEYTNDWYLIGTELPSYDVKFC